VLGYGNSTERRGLPLNAPVLAIISALTLMAFAVVVIVTGYGGESSGQLLVALILSTVPSLIAAAFAERASRDIRNGVVTAKARKGAQAALDDTGLTEWEGQLMELTAQVARNTSHIEALYDVARRQHPDDEGLNHG
jgi:hypothetical protein